MNSLWFWKNWSRDYQVVWYGLCAVLVFAFVFMWVGYEQGPDAVMDWETFEQQVDRETISHTFGIGNFEFSVPIESYLTFEYFNGTMVHPNTTASYFFLAGLVVISLLLLTVITTLEKFWYYVGMGLFIVFMVSLRLEVLQLFREVGRTVPIIIIGIYVALSFFFSVFRSSTPFLLRFIVFFTVTLIVGLCIHFFAGVKYPFLHLAVTGYATGLILSVVFILMIAHEIMASFVYVTSSGTSSSKSLRHFFIISLIYLLNLALAYMHEAGIITWNFIYINLYLLFSISAILGIWGFRHRETLYENILPFDPLGAYVIASLAALSFFTTGMLLGNHNDAALKVIRDAIIFSHLGYGAIFLIYFISNFMVMVAENLGAWKVLYKPTRMPYFTFRLAGLIATLGFVFYSNWREYPYHGISGFYNQLGDLYQLLDQKLIAEAYYQKGRTYGFENNRSNYVLGLMESHKNNFKEAHHVYELSNGKRPTEYSLVNNANLYIIERSFFEAIPAFTKALKIFPNSGVIQNNLGFAFSKIHKLDSALIMLDKSRQHSVSKNVAEANFIGIVALEFLPVKADSLLIRFNSTSPLAISNALAVASMQEQPFNFEFNPLQHEELNLATASLLNNYLVHSLKSLDSTTINAASQIISDSFNIDYSEALKATLAQAYYHKNNVYKALSTISELAFLSQVMQGKYSYIAGLWALEQGSPELAIAHFDYAVLFDYKDARLYNAIALAEAHRTNEAIAAADSLLNQPEEEVREIGRQLRKILACPPAEVTLLSDSEKYQYCRHRIGHADTLLFNRIVESMESSDYKAITLLEMSKRQHDMLNYSAAVRYFNRAINHTVSDKSLLEDLRFFELELLASQGNVQALADRMNTEIAFPVERELEKLLYEALMSAARNELDIAERNFAIVANYNPFFEEGIIAAARFYRDHSEDDMKAYSTLVRAIHTNTTSYRLWRAYAEEAARVGFESQAEYALQQAEELRRRK